MIHDQLERQLYFDNAVFEDGRATGIVYRDKSGQERTVHARGEVILSSGAVVPVTDVTAVREPAT